MASMEKSVFIGFADRLAKQYLIMKEALTEISDPGTGTFYERITGTQDSDVEIPMLEASYNLDEYLSSSDAATQIITNLPAFNELISSFTTHVGRADETEASWNAYCEQKDVRVSEYTNNLFFACYRRNLDARNVFSESEAVFGSCEIGPSGIIFYDGTDFGTGDSTEKADGIYFAAAPLQAYLTSEITTPLTIKLIGRGSLGEDYEYETDAVIVGASGTYVSITPASGRFLAVNNVEQISGGEEGNTFEIRTIKEREVTL